MQLIPLILLLGVPILIIGVLIWGRRTNKLPVFIVPLFFIGCAIGASWEIGFSVLSMDGVAEPLSYQIEPGGNPARDSREPSSMALFIYTAIILPLVCIWDAGLLLFGIWLSRIVLGNSVLRNFSWAALGIMMLWGQLQSFLVEMGAIDFGVWAYRVTSYNPGLFQYGEAWITALPQLVWLIASPVFYWAYLRYSKDTLST